MIFSSLQFSCSVVSNSLWPYESQHTRPPCPSPTPGVHSNSHPSSRWCHPAISSSVVPFSSCPQSLPASESFPMSQLFAWGGQSIGVYYSVKQIFLKSTVRLNTPPRVLINSVVTHKIFPLPLIQPPLTIDTPDSLLVSSTLIIWFASYNLKPINQCINPTSSRGGSITSLYCLKSKCFTTS